MIPTGIWLASNWLQNNPNAAKQFACKVTATAAGAGVTLAMPEVEIVGIVAGSTVEQVVESGCLSAVAFVDRLIEERREAQVLREMLDMAKQAVERFERESKSLIEHFGQQPRADHEYHLLEPSMREMASPQSPFGGEGKDTHVSVGPEPSGDGSADSSSEQSDEGEGEIGSRLP